MPIGTISFLAFGDRLPSGQIATAPGLSASSVIEDEGQQLVLDGDQQKRLFRDVPVDGGDRRHRLADETHRVVEER